MSNRVVIIGGGFAGLAAGVYLSERGFAVTLLERRNHLGGRAYSFTDTKTGDTVDNGQHLFMGCYYHTIDFLKKIGTLDRLSFQEQPRVDFLDAVGRSDSFDCPALPAPLHVLAGLFLMKGLSFGDKVRALNIGGALRGSVEKNGALTVTEWLKSLKQSDRVNERFWNPMAIATLNESPEIASAKMMKKVLQEAFGAGREASAMGIANVGLSELYTDAARQFIEMRGGEVRLRTQISRLVVESEAVATVELKSGERVKADFFISAVPPNILWQLLDENLRAREFSYLSKLQSSPIVSINLWFDRPVTDKQFLGLIGTRVQWLFNKDAISATAKKTNQLALIISAARGFTEWTKNQLVEMAMTELRQVIPASRKARLLHSAVVKERDATLSHTVESDALRPRPQTSIPNFILAGDWTETGLPATIESAVLSGKRAAEIVSSKFDTRLK